MIKLIRFCSNSEMGTFSHLYFDNKKVGYTVEQDWHMNIRYHSCVPKGHYQLLDFKSSKYGNTFCLYSEELEVFANDEGYGRYACLIHPANTASELQGCIAPGLHLGYVNSKWAVTSSRQAFEMVVKEIKKGNNELIIE